MLHFILITLDINNWLIAAIHVDISRVSFVMVALSVKKYIIPYPFVLEKGDHQLEINRKYTVRRQLCGRLLIISHPFVEDDLIHFSPAPTTSYRWNLISDL